MSCPRLLQQCGGFLLRELYQFPGKGWCATPPLALIPNRPAGASDILSYGYGGGMDPGRSGDGGYSYDAQREDVRNRARNRKREADRAYNLKRDKLEQDYKIAKLNARTNREKNAIDKWYNEQQVAIARDRLAEEKRQFDEDLVFRKQVHADEFGLSQARLGYDVLGMQAQLRGPENYYQAAEYARGVAAQPGTATFLNALKNNAKLAPYGAQAGVPDKVSVNSLAAKVGGPNIIPGTGTAQSPSVTAATNDADNLGAIRDLYAAGAHKLGANSLEQLTDTELKLLKSGIDAAGGDWATFMSQYGRSRIGQGVGGANYRTA